jgi:thiol-disulfide isomerase/thioredoxin/outer membrane lipoprotein-sorting protein
MFSLQPDPKTLLRDAAAKYRTAQTFQLEWQTKITTSSPYAEGWIKQTYIVAADQTKFHFEQQGNGFASIRISDGESDWFYRPGVNRYYIQPVDLSHGQSRARGSAGGTTSEWVKTTMRSLLQLDDDANDAELTGEEVLKLDGEKIPCHIVRSTRSMSYREGSTTVRDNIYWIDTKTGLVRKSVLTTTGPASLDDAQNEQKRVVEIVYTKVSLGSAVPALFEFKPPAKAYLVDDARRGPSNPPAIGSVAPALKLKSSEFNFDLTSLKGKVVLVQFWATWCGACLQEMKKLSQLPKTYPDKGLVIVSIDEDEVPEEGDKVFASQDVAWKNLHDVGEVHQKSWGVTAFPFVALIDREGKVRWTETGSGAGFFETLQNKLQAADLRLQ